jgi:hypothetical protein
MGKRANGSDQGNIETGAASVPSGGSADTKTTGAETTGAETTGAASGNASGGETEKERVPQLVTITTDKETGEKKVSKRTLQRRAAKAKKEIEENALSLKPHLKMLIMVSFDMTAKRLGDHWRITDQEAEQVAEPLSKILGKYMKASETMEKYADWFGVIGALAMIILPRWMIHQQIMKEKKKGEANNATARNSNGPSTLQSGRTGPVTSKGATIGTNGPSSRPPAASGTNGIKNLLPVLA